MNKSQLRRQLLQQRQALSPSLWREKSDRLCTHLQQLPLFQTANTILAYFSFRQEPDLSPLFSLPKRWGFPRCVAQSLAWHEWKLNEPLNKGKYGINEPLSTYPIISPATVDLMLVPGVACDRQGYRLGYGGGFYDRLLSDPQWQSIPTLGIVFEFAYLPQLRIDTWDQPLDGICSENRCLLFSQTYF